MGKTLYLECASGISGDMMVAALLDLGASETVLLKVLDRLPVSGFETKVSRVKKSGIAAFDFSVILDEMHENHDHDMDYLHGQDSPHVHEDDQDHNCTHVHENQHDHDCAHVHEDHHGHDCAHMHEHHHGHTHRGMKEIREIIDQAQMTDRAKATTRRIFEILAQAEAKAHEVPVEEVHFHEVGAVDSIVDIVSVAVCLDNLDITEVVVPSVCEGQGTVRCQHGILPIPVPAVANIVEQHQIRLKRIPDQGEFVTPTGAAIVAAIRTSEQLPEEYYIEKTGIGAGKRSYTRPSLLRAMLIRKATPTRDRIYKLESNIDDCSGEVLGFVMEELMKAGARDVHYVPAYMKKNRPAWILQVICDEEDISAMERIIFRETTTIGIRRIAMERTVLEREEKQVHTSYGTASVKICRTEDTVRYYPEYESAAAIARKQQIPLMEAYRLLEESSRT